MATYKNGKLIKTKTSPIISLAHEKRKHVAALIETAIRENHFCHQTFKNAASNLVDSILQTKVAIGKNKNNGIIYGATSLSKIFSNSFDSAILEVFPIGSFIHLSFSVHFNHEYPLSQYLSHRSSYLEFREIIHQVSRQYREYCRQNDSHEVFDTNCTNMEFLMVILNDLAEIAPLSIKPKWCSVCFRRYPCAEHRTNLGDKNLEYENGRSIRRYLTKDALKCWKSHHSQRKLLGEEFTLVSSVDDIIENHNCKILIIDISIHELIKMTENQLWTIASQYWEVFIKENFQQISSKLPLSSNFIDFNTYEGEVLSVLNNKSEKSNHPLWFLYMLDEANDWCIAEQNKSIKTIDKILEYYPNITTNQSEIAKKIGCTKSAVSKALNIYKAKVY